MIIIIQPKVLILDKATSSLDSLTEQKIFNNLKLMNFTQIVIAHRLTSIEDADKIYVLDKGEVIEYGTHMELM